MSYFNYSPVQGPRSNIGVTPRQSTQNTSYGSRMQSSASNNRLHPSQSNQQTSVYGRPSQSIQSVGSNQYLQSTPSNGFQGRQSQSQYGRTQVGRNSTSSKGYPSTMAPGSMLQASSQGQQLSGGPDGVKYIPLNWEDLLGGKEGMKGLQVSMAPSGDPGNSNRQLKFSFGSPGQGDAPAAPGEVPLKVVSFQPVEDYPGKGGKPITMNSQQMMVPAMAPAKSSGYPRQQQQPQYQQMPQQYQSQQPLRSNAVMAPSANTSMPGQPQMIMMPPVYYTPGKGIISGPGMQGQNSCKGCPNCKGNSVSNNQRY